jgi:lipoyl(octanoyl) transferase
MRTLEVERLGRIAYDDALDLQQKRIEARRSGEIGDRLLLLEHPHVITLGSSASAEHVLVDAAARERLGITIHEVGRGGDVTYHGPGQLVGYPILDLKPDRKDLHRYLRDIEESLIHALESLGVRGGERRPGMTGVWLPTGKVAAIGIRVSSGWITSHGFALNVSTDLAYFNTIIPCGIESEAVTSLERILGVAVSMESVEVAIIQAFETVFAYASGSPASQSAVSS